MPFAFVEYACDEREESRGGGGLPRWDLGDQCVGLIATFGSGVFVGSGEWMWRHLLIECSVFFSLYTSSLRGRHERVDGGGGG